MVKPRSKQANTQKKPEVDDLKIEALANAIADKPYGKVKLPSELSNNKPQNEAMERITITLPSNLRIVLEDLAITRKRAGNPNKNVSAIIREALDAYLPNLD